jgi:hypothetical protein
MVNVMQQVGGALGLAILVTVFGTASRAAARHPLLHAGPVAQAHDILTRGMSTSFRVAAVFDLCALLIVALVIKIRQPAQAAVPASPAPPAGVAAAEREAAAESVMADLGDPV